MICSVCRRPLFRSAVEGRSIGPVCAKRGGLITSKRRMASHVDDATPDLFDSEKTAASEVATERAAP